MRIIFLSQNYVNHLTKKGQICEKHAGLMRLLHDVIDSGDNMLRTFVFAAGQSATRTFQEDILRFGAFA